MNDETTSTASLEEVGTTERLFGREEAEASVETTPEPVAESDEPSREAKPRDESGKFVSQKAEPQSNAVDDEYLPVEALANKKLKIKVNGEEQELTFSEALRNIQTNQYLTQKGQKLAEEYRQLQALKARPETPQAATPQTSAPDDDFYREYVQPHVEPYKQKVAEFESIMNSVSPILGDIKYQSDLKKLDSTFKEQGLDDFMQYVPRIEQHILQQDIEAQMNLRSFEFYSDFYKTEKLKETMAALKNPPKVETKLPDQRPRPKVVNIESGGGTPTGNDDRTSHLNALRDRAAQSGRTQDWAAYIQDKLGG